MSIGQLIHLQSLLGLSQRQIAACQAQKCIIVFGVGCYLFFTGLYGFEQISFLLLRIVQLAIMLCNIGQYRGIGGLAFELFFEFFYLYQAGQHEGLAAKVGGIEGDFKLYLFDRNEEVFI